MKVSIIIPVYFNEKNLIPLYDDLKSKFIDKIDYQYELVMVDDGSKDKSYEVMKDLSFKDNNIKIIRLSKNFGSHAAILCGLANCVGDAAIVKAADLQEPTEMLHEMIDSWKIGNNVVLAVRTGREESFMSSFFSDLYYEITRKIALPNMPKKGFDVYLLDRKVINVLINLDEKNSALTGQVLWSGFKTGIVYYKRLARTVGKSKWTLKKKIKLVMDTVYGFTSLPISIVMFVGVISILISIIWSIVLVVLKTNGSIQVSGWTSLFIFNLLTFGITMITLGIIGEYLWRTFDASRKRPPYIIEDSNLNDYE